MNDNSTPKVIAPKPLFIVMNEDGEIDAGASLEEAAGRLDRRFVGNMLRAARVTIHMEAPTVEDHGDVIIHNVDAKTFRIERRD